MGNNIQRLGESLSSRMKKTADGAVPTTIELGTINGNMSLTTDSLQAEIPKGDYMVNLTLTGGYNTSETTHTHDGGSHTHSGGAHAQYEGTGEHTHSGGTHTHSGGSHSHRLPGNFRGLQAGDRVLVAWCGNDPVIIAIVVSS